MMSVDKSYWSDTSFDMKPKTDEEINDRVDKKYVKLGGCGLF